MSLSLITKRIYAAAWTEFEQWLGYEHVGHPAAPAVVARYLASIARRAPSLATVHLAAIAGRYREMGWDLDTKSPRIAAEVRLARRRAENRRALLAMVPGAKMIQRRRGER